MPSAGRREEKPTYEVCLVCQRPSARKAAIKKRYRSREYRLMTLFICSAVTAAALYYVFFFPGEVYAGEEKTRLGYLRERKEAVYENLRDLNFEFKAGKVAEADYQSMRASLEEEAAAVMAEIGRLELMQVESR